MDGPTEVIIMLYQLLDAAGNIEKISTNISTIEMVENRKSGAEEENKANESETEQTEAHWNTGNKPGTIRERSRKKWNPYNS